MELAQKYPAYGEPNRVLTKNVKLSDYQGDRTYLSVTVVVGVQSVSGNSLALSLSCSLLHASYLAHALSHTHSHKRSRSLCSPPSLPPSLSLTTDVRDTNMVLVREMMVMAKGSGLEFTHEI